MSYNIKKHVNRLAWRLSNKRQFTPNDDDIESLNSIIDWINRQEKENVRTNILFAKLYIYHLNQTIDYFNSTIFDDIPQKDLSRILDIPLDNFYISFKNSLYNNQFDRIKKLKDLNDIKEIYDLETITEKLNEMISEALNRLG